MNKQPDHASDSSESGAKIVNAKTLFWNRVQLILILVVFAAPIVGAYIYKPDKFNNYGDLYSPIRQVDNLSMQGVDGLVELTQLRGQWVFLVTASATCEQACEDNILKIRQLRVMQNKNMMRIRSVFLHSGLTSAVAVDLAAKYSPIESYAVPKADFDKWTSVLKLDDAPAEAQLNRFYVIDPAGNLIISYPATAEPNYINKDMKRLLKTS